MTSNKCPSCDEYSYLGYPCSQNCMDEYREQETLRKIIEKDVTWNGKKQSRMHLKIWGLFSPHTIPSSVDQLDNLYKEVMKYER